MAAEKKRKKKKGRSGWASKRAGSEHLRTHASAAVCARAVRRAPQQESAYALRLAADVVCVDISFPVARRS